MFHFIDDRQRDGTRKVKTFPRFWSSGIIEKRMKIFEFQFNPKAKSDRFFRVFSFPAPKEMLDRGDMYIMGELKNALPANANFLDQLATLLSKEYYDAEKPNLNASHRLKNALKKGNSF